MYNYLKACIVHCTVHRKDVAEGNCTTTLMSLCIEDMKGGGGGGVETRPSYHRVSYAF